MDELNYRVVLWVFIGSTVKSSIWGGLRPFFRVPRHLRKHTNRLRTDAAEVFCQGSQTSQGCDKAAVALGFAGQGSQLRAWGFELMGLCFVHGFS